MGQTRICLPPQGPSESGIKFLHLSRLQQESNSHLYSPLLFWVSFVAVGCPLMGSSNSPLGPGLAPNCGTVYRDKWRLSRLIDRLNCGATRFPKGLRALMVYFIVMITGTGVVPSKVSYNPQPFPWIFANL